MTENCSYGLMTLQREHVHCTADGLLDSGDLNEYLRGLLGQEVSAKDFRTWHATVLAAAGLAVSQQLQVSSG